MKVENYYFIALFTLISSSVLFSQNIKFGIGGGYAYIDNDTYYTRDVESSYFPNQLGLRNCYVINSKIKYEPTESPIIFTGELLFLSATNEVDYLGYYSSLQSSPAKMHLEASQDIYSFGIGIEAPIINSIVTPYFALGILANYFGKTKVERTPELDFIFDRIELDEFLISDKLRVGLNVGIGVDYQFLEILSFDICAKYNFMNMIFKKEISKTENEENFNTFSITANILYSF
jgi:opacity protein-like surface antigen